MRNLQVALCTIKRDPEYIHEMMSSLLSCDPHMVRQLRKIWVMVGSPEVNYLSHYKNDSRFRIEPMGEKEWETTKDKEIPHRMLVNYARCLSIPRCGHTGLLIVEDDIIFRDGFFTKLDEVLQEVEEEEGTDGQFVLSCYSGYDFRHAQDHPGKLYCQHPYHNFYGTQAHYFPRHSWSRIGFEMMVKAGLCYKWPTDILLGKICNEFDIKIISPRLSLVQHIGVISTGCNMGKFHENDTFAMPWVSNADPTRLEGNIPAQS